jgi:AcrR family transcriptional regulator
MAGRKPLDREQLNRGALDAAAAIISARGLAALNAREVAGAINVSVGSLYNAFGSLDELVFALNAETLDQLYEHMLAAAGQEGEPIERMAALARAYIDYAASRPLLWRAVFEHQPGGGRAKPEGYFAKIEKIAILAIGIMRPLYGPDERAAARRMATILWSGVHGICALAQGGNLRTVTREDPRAMAEALVRACLAGVAAERAPKASRQNL